MRAAKRRYLTFLMLLGCGACRWECTSSGRSGGVVDQARYEPDAVDAWLTVPFASPAPTANFPVSLYRLSLGTTLPDGLSLDSQTGQIVGLPTRVSPATEYLIDAVRTTGMDATARITIEVHDALAPSGLTYTPNPIIGLQSGAIVPSVPSLTGVPQTYSIDPALPTGLVLDPDTGILTGNLVHAVGTAQYTVTATNPLGSTQAVVEITAIPTRRIQGLLATSYDDHTLEAFRYEYDGLSVHDSESFFGGRPTAVAATSDGEHIYVATDGSLLFRVERDPVSGELSAPESLGNYGQIRRLALSSDDLRLIAVRDNQLERYDIQPGGGLVSSGQAPGPASGASSVFVGPSSSYLAVGATSPGSVWIYDVEPDLVVRGVPFSIDPQAYVNDMHGYAEFLFAATSTYNFNSNEFEGHVRGFSVATSPEVLAGADALTQVQDLAQGRNLTSITPLATPFDYPLGSLLGDFAITDSSLSLIYLAEFDNSLVGPIATPMTSYPVPGFPSDCVLATPPIYFPPVLYVLDSVDERIRTHKLSAGLPLASELATRGRAFELLTVRGDASTRGLDAVFVPGATEADLRGFEFVAPGGLAALAQAPTSTGGGAVDAIVHPFLPVLYTAERDTASIGVFGYDSGTKQLATIEDEALPPGSQPISLALGLGGAVLYAVDPSGGVSYSAVDPTTGALSVQGGLLIPGSLVGARLCADPMGRYVYLAQPAAGAVLTLPLAPGDGQPSLAATSNVIQEPVDLAASRDGRFLYVLDRAQARIVPFRVDSTTGQLLATAGGASIGAAPTRMTLDAKYGEARLYVIDPSVDTCFRLECDLSTGSLSPEPQASFSIASDARSVAVLRTISGNYTVVFTHDHPGGATLDAYRTIAPGVLGPWTSHPVGSGPVSIAVLERYVAD